MKGYRDDNGFSWPEELQRDPDPPRRPWWSRAAWVALGLVIGVLVA